MKKEIKPLENCNILQACEWIAFGWTPTSPIYDNADGRERPLFLLYKTDAYKIDSDTDANEIDSEAVRYSRAIYDAQGKLHLALHQGKIHATGVTEKKSEILGLESAYNAEKQAACCEEEENEIENKFTKAYVKLTGGCIRRLITTVSANVETAIEPNRIIDGNDSYRGVEIPFRELQKVFPAAIVGKLFLEDDILYFQPKFGKREEVHRFRNMNSKNYLVLQYIIDRPREYITYKDIAKANLGIKLDDGDRVDLSVRSSFDKKYKHLIGRFFDLRHKAAKYIP